MTLGNERRILMILELVFHDSESSGGQHAQNTCKFRRKTRNNSEWSRVVIAFGTPEGIYFTLGLSVY